MITEVMSRDVKVEQAHAYDELSLSLKVAPAQNLFIPCKLVENFGQKLEVLIHKMNSFMLLKNGVGLAAPQVNYNIAAVVLSKEAVKRGTSALQNAKIIKDGKHICFALINPRIIKKSTIFVDLIPGGEVCLSMPGPHSGSVQRHATIELEYFNIKGDKFTETINSITATVLQHEIDHLFGIMYPARMKDRQREVLIKKYSLANNLNNSIMEAFVAKMIQNTGNENYFENLDALIDFAKELQIEENIIQEIRNNIADL